MTNRFPSLHMNAKVFSQESYKISDPTMVIDHPPIDPSFREVLKQGALFPTSHSLQLQQLEGWEKLARAGIHINSHADMFLYGIYPGIQFRLPCTPPPPPPPPQDNFSWVPNCSLGPPGWETKVSSKKIWFGLCEIAWFLCQPIANLRRGVCL